MPAGSSSFFTSLAPSPRSSGVRAHDGAAGGMVPHTVRQHVALERQSSLRTVARRACPTSILSGVCDAQQSRSALPKLPETEKARPGMKATPWATATSNSFEVSIALLKVTHRKKPPSGLVHVASAVGPGNVNGGD